MTPLICQAFLTAEIPARKGRVLIKELGLLDDSGLTKLIDHPLLSKAERARLANLDRQTLTEALRKGVQATSFREYSEPLRAWPDNPPAVFTWGDWSCALNPTVAIVGTRGASIYGKAVAMKFAETLARAGMTVVSGGALGVDASAHKGALSVGGSTIAVLAGGVDTVYPSMHRGLFQQIREGGGCLVSQFACGVKPDYYRFLVRNQLVAALSQAIIVIEAPERSGALSTAHRANELGRQVFVVPANIDNINFRGSHSLIRDGATLVDHPNQVLEALEIEPPIPPTAAPLSDTGAKIISVLTGEPLAADFILERTGLTMNELMSELTVLEMEGRVLQSPGGFSLKP